MSQRKRRSNESSSNSSRPTDAALTADDATRYALRGRSSEQTPEERASVRRVIMFPFIGDTKAVAVRPRVSDREVAAARRLTERPQPAKRRRCEVRAAYYSDQVAA